MTNTAFRDLPVAVIACRVFEASLHPWLDADTPVTFLDYGLHDTSRKLKAAIQEAVDALAQPSLILMGYGLCGNGLDGLKSRQHWLVIPRVDDCVALFLGSRAAYKEQFARTPGTYYLSKGWLEGAVDPMGSYEKYRAKYGEEQADFIFDSLYHNYKRLAFVAHCQADVEQYGPRARACAEFCRQRCGMAYEEILGSDAYLKRLMEAPANLSDLGEDFLVIPPGGEVKQAMFI